MALTRAQMDRKMDEHFAFEAADDVEGVLATLSEDAEHDIVGLPTGPTRGREGPRGFYETLFGDLAEGRVETLKRYYGDDFLVDESMWRGGAAGRPPPGGGEGSPRPLPPPLLLASVEGGGGEGGGGEGGGVGGRGGD